VGYIENTKVTLEQLEDKLRVVSKRLGERQIKIIEELQKAQKEFAKTNNLVVR
jgi:hypothetical protein